MKKAFTLIELLIVVAIIAILAAIAVPNFLEAQTRAKVSRTKADMRSVATAIESYKVDNSAGPTDAGNGAGGIFRPYANPPMSGADPRPNFSIGFELTTPIAYMSSAAALVDPFKSSEIRKYEDNPALRGRQYYNFTNPVYRFKVTPTAGNATVVRILSEFIGDWTLMGAGPDKWVNNAPDNRIPSGATTPDFGSTNIPRCIPYDPTNGTVSNGDIYRSHKQGDGVKVRTGVI